MPELNTPAAAHPDSISIRYRNILPDARSGISVFLAAADLLALLTIPFLRSLLQQSVENLQRYLCFWILLAVITIMLIASHGGYRRHRSGPFQKQTALAVNCLFATSFAMFWLAVLLGHSQILTRRWTIADLILTPFMLAGIRAAFSRFIASNEDLEASAGPLLICYDQYPTGLRQAMIEQHLPSHISGVFYLMPTQARKTPSEWQEMSDFCSLIETIQVKNVQDVIFVQHAELGSFLNTARRGLFAELMGLPVRIWLAVDLTANLPDMLKSRSASCKILPIITDELVNSSNLTKRTVDVLGSLTLLALTSPILLVTALMIKTFGTGPVVFRQLRIGAHGKAFTVFKFRTMADLPSIPFSQAQRVDHRVTRIGKYLRRSSIDELLQLFNVLRGDMSLVGPRPHAPETQVEGVDFENAVKLYRLRQRVKPGITGLAQVRGQRGETPLISVLEQRVASDIEYIECWSLWLDLAIMFQTLPVVFTQTNAY